MPGIGSASLNIPGNGLQGAERHQDSMARAGCWLPTYAAICPPSELLPGAQGALQGLLLRSASLTSTISASGQPARLDLQQASAHVVDKRSIQRYLSICWGRWWSRRLDH